MVLSLWSYLRINADRISAPFFLAYLYDLSAWEAAEMLSAASVSKESLK